MRWLHTPSFRWTNSRGGAVSAAGLAAYVALLAGFFACGDFDKIVARCRGGTS
jgi:hypothetical protein